MNAPALRMTHAEYRAFERQATVKHEYIAGEVFAIDAVDADVYPDLSVVCGPPRTAEADDHALINPTLIVEILSNSTEGYDRGLKASYYRRIPSLQAYLLGQQLTIESLGVVLDVDAIYRDALERP